MTAHLLARLLQPILPLRQRLLSRLLFSLVFSVTTHSSIAAEQPTSESSNVAATSTSPASGDPSPSTTVPADPELSEAPKAEIAPLEQTVETFITSEEIDTDKAVDFPTNI